MSRFCLVAALSLGGLLLFATAAVQASTITCESRDNARQTCPVDTSGGVRVSRQLSTQGCWQDDTWGYDRNRIWVDRGCRAEFQVGGQNASSSSKNDAVAAAAIVGLAAAAIIAANQHDDHHNKNHNDNYNYNNRSNDSYNDRYNDRDYDNNRGGNYDNGRYGYNGYGGDPRWTFSCESNGSRTAYCNIPKRGHVEVYKQRSSKPCIYGRSWGVDGNRLWVDEGCRAEFAVF